MAKSLAKFISTLGHPLVTVPIVVIYILFCTQTPRNAFFISVLMICGIQLPVLVNLYRKYKKGTIDNFDVSDRQERKKFYFLVFPLLIGVNLILYFTRQPIEVQFSFLMATVLLFLMQLMNYYVKSSLHVAINVYIGFLLFNLFPIYAIVWWFFVLFIAWSRLVLKRHSLTEIIFGFLIGTLCGSILFCLV